jgi:uncharacterized membrane protein YtjA (UPF0391 family)
MLSWVVTFLVVALIAGVLGFGGIAGVSIEIAKTIFFHRGGAVPDLGRDRPRARSHQRLISYRRGHRDLSPDALGARDG